MASSSAPTQACPEAHAVGVDLRKARDALAQGYRGPVLLLDLDIVRAKARRFRKAMPRVRPHYAVKANPHPAVLKVLGDEGIAFEIASAGELGLLSGLDVPARNVFYSNPVKCREHVARAAERGVEWFVVDSVEELRKIAGVKPDADCVCASTCRTRAATGRSRASSARAPRPRARLSRSPPHLAPISPA